MTTILSEAGTVRRNALRVALVQRMQRTRRARRGLQATLLVGAALLVALGFGRGRGTGDLQPPPAVAPTAWLRVQFVRDEPGIVDRLRLPAGPSAVQRLADEDLLLALRRSGREVGIVRLAGELRLPGLVPDDWQ
jgi:hypothetical protein